MKKLDLTGQRFGRLLVIKESGYSFNGRVTWLCKCDCGNYTSTPNTKSLRRGTCNSCGCHALENLNRLTHGKSKEKLYYVRNGMKQRCYNPNSTSYNAYGGRGIKVCDEWRDDFMAFYNWAIANGYEEGLSIDRIDNGGDYEPSNCQWITQAENTRKARMNKK